MNSGLDSNELFPLLASIEGTYEAAKNHSRRVDGVLGLDISGTEGRISDESAPWRGLDPDVLQTPYTELRFMLARINPARGMKVVELGSGYSRLAHVLEAHHEGVFYEGVELVPERASEALRVIRARGLLRAVVRAGDLFGKEGFPRGDVYFLYDLSPRIESSVRVVEALQREAANHPILVAARGLASRGFIEREAPWLSHVISPEHHGNFSIYRSG